MKKNKLSLIAALTLATAIISNSCEKIEEGSPVTVNTSKTATISGMVHANIKQDERVYLDGIHPNYTNSTSNGHIDTSEYAPAGTEIHFRVKKNELNSDVIDTDDMLLYTTTVGANGSYSISIPTNEESVEVSISFDDFEIDSSYFMYTGATFQDSTFFDTDPATGQPIQVTVITDSAQLYTSTTRREVYTRANSSRVIHENEDVILDFNY